MISRDLSGTFEQRGGGGGSMLEWNNVTLSMKQNIFCCYMICKEGNQLKTSKSVQNCNTKQNRVN
jgi:hypothetical protein